MTIKQLLLLLTATSTLPMLAMDALAPKRRKIEVYQDATTPEFEAASRTRSGLAYSPANLTPVNPRRLSGYNLRSKLHFGDDTPSNSPAQKRTLEPATPEPFDIVLFNSYPSMNKVNGENEQFKYFIQLMSQYNNAENTHVSAQRVIDAALLCGHDTIYEINQNGPVTTHFTVPGLVLIQSLNAPSKLDILMGVIKKTQGNFAQKKIAYSDPETHQKKAVHIEDFLNYNNMKKFNFHEINGVGKPTQRALLLSTRKGLLEQINNAYKVLSAHPLATSQAVKLNTESRINTIR